MLVFPCESVSVSVFIYIFIIQSIIRLHIKLIGSSSNLCWLIRKDKIAMNLREKGSAVSTRKPRSNSTNSEVTITRKQRNCARRCDLVNEKERDAVE